MEHDEIFQHVRAAMVRAFQLRDDRGISNATTAADIDGWDSLSHSMLIMAIENDLGTDLPLDRASRAQNVGELVEIVHDTLH